MLRTTANVSWSYVISKSTLNLALQQKEISALLAELDEKEKELMEFHSIKVTSKQGKYLCRTYLATKVLFCNLS